MEPPHTILLISTQDETLLSLSLLVICSPFLSRLELWMAAGNQTQRQLSPCLVTKFKIPKKIPAPAWRLKSRRNKKRIATAVCKWRDESNEPN